MNNIKMIVTDLDGTLLKTDKSISEYTETILAKCRKAGIKVVYATARGRSAERLAQEGFFDGRITMNGSIAVIGGVTVYNRLIPYATARPILIACDRYGLKVASEISGMHYSNFNVSEQWPSITNFKIVDFAQHDIDAEKLYAIVSNSNESSFIETTLPDELHMTVSRDGLAQIMHREASKSKAVAALAQVWGIDQSEIAAFGDDLNDIDMLLYAGIGLAMENALDEVKASADLICLSNDDDGVARWVEANIVI